MAIAISPAVDAAVNVMQACNRMGRQLAAKREVSHVIYTIRRILKATYPSQSHLHPTYSVKHTALQQRAKRRQLSIARSHTRAAGLSLLQPTPDHLSLILRI